MSSKNDDGPIMMLASYRVEEERMGSFLELLRETEALYRSHELITSAPIRRLQSLQDPELVVELIEWRSPEHLREVMDNAEVMEMWSRIKASWKAGDFPFSAFPEASVPWAVLRTID